MRAFPGFFALKALFDKFIMLINVFAFKAFVFLHYGNTRYRDL
jgi:hypothetical protein